MRATLGDTRFVRRAGMHSAAHRQGMCALHAPGLPTQRFLKAPFRTQKPQCSRVVCRATAAAGVKDIGSESVRGTVRKQNEDRFAVKVWPQQVAV